MKKLLSLTAAFLVLLLLLAGCASAQEPWETWETWEPGTTFHPSLSFTKEQKAYLDVTYYKQQWAWDDGIGIFPQVSFDSQAKGFGTPEFGTIIKQVYLLPQMTKIEFKGCKGCLDLTCTDPDHFHWCSPGCNEVEHYHARYQWKQFQ